MSNPQLREEASVIMDPSAKPRDFLMAAVHGVSMATPYVLKQQSALTGQSELEIENELTKMKALVANPDALMKEATKFLPPDKRMELESLKTKGILAKGKEEQARFQALKVAAAIDIMKASKSNSLLGNAESWKSVDGMRLVDLPEFDSYRAAKKPISLDVIYREFVHNAPKEAKSTRAALVQQHLFENAARLNGTLYGDVVDLTALKARTQAMAIPGIFDSISIGLDKALRTPGAIPLITPF